MAFRIQPGANKFRRWNGENPLPPTGRCASGKCWFYRALTSRSPNPVIGRALEERRLPEKGPMMTAESSNTPDFNFSQSSAISKCGHEPRMSSREISELTGKEHDNVRRDIKNMAKALSLIFEEKVEPSTGGRPCRIYLLPKRECLVLVSGYDVHLRARIIDRWQELEAAPRALDPQRVLSDPASLRTLLLQNVERVIALQGEVEEMRPQVQALERIAVSDGSMCITDAAKTLQVQPKALFAFLRSHHWMYTRQGSSEYIAYQDKLASGLLEHKTTTVTKSDGYEKTVTQVRITAKGLTRLAKEFAPVARAA